LCQVPILTKNEARLNESRLINLNRSRFAFIFRTSGSTGHPFKALISPAHWIIEQSCIWRHWGWAGYKFRDRMAIVRSHVPKDDSDLIKWDKIRNFIYFSPFHLTDNHISLYLQKMVDLKVKFLRGYPSSILAIADYISRHPDVAKPCFTGVLTASEYLGKTQATFIEKYLGAKVFNHYGLAEQVVMFGSCESGNQLHNYQESGYLELLDTESTHIKKIVGTNLHNLAMPLIRYDTGDLADVSVSHCSCNRSSPSLLNVLGRRDSVIDLNDGSSVPVTNFYTMFEHYGSYFSSWQLIQGVAGSLKIIVDLYKGISISVLEELLRNDIQKRLGSKCQLFFDFSGNFVLVGEGKKNPFIKVSE
jgi:phenylacetate-CoA ligase